MTDFPDELTTAQSRWWLPCSITIFLAVAALSSARAADPISISFTSATKKNYSSSVLWKVPAPSGSQMVIKAIPGVFAQTQSVTLDWKGFKTTDQVFPTPPPGPNAVLLGAKGETAVPIVFGKDSHKQWYITACVKWQPPGYDHKIDDCVYVYLEGIDQVADNAGNLITIISPPHPGLAHNWVKIPLYGNAIGVSVRSDILAKSTDKIVRFTYKSSTSTGQPGNSWPAPTGKMAPKTIALSGVASQGGWSQKSEPLVPDPHMGDWLTVKACLTLEYSGEVCSNTYAYQVMKPPLKASDIDKNMKIGSGQPVPPLSPQPGGGQAGQSGNMPTGGTQIMAPPPVLGAPAASPPGPAGGIPQVQPASPMMAPAASSNMKPSQTAPLTSLPGCTANPGVPGQYACATREAYAGCERLRASAASGVRACQSGGGDQRRR